MEKAPIVQEAREAATNGQTFFQAGFVLSQTTGEITNAGRVVPKTSPGTTNNRANRGHRGGRLEAG